MTGIEILPVGEESVYVDQKMDLSEFILIYDMDVYAEEVLLKIRKAMRKHISPEQKIAFSTAKRAARKRLIEQSLLKP